MHFGPVLGTSVTPPARSLLATTVGDRSWPALAPDAVRQVSPAALDAVAQIGPVATEVVATAAALLAVGLVIAYELGLLGRFTATGESTVAGRIANAPARADADDLDHLIGALETHAAGHEPATVDVDELRAAIGTLASTRPALIASDAERFARHIDHPVPALRAAVTFALAAAAREEPEALSTHADSFATRLGDDDPTVRSNAVWYFRWLAAGRIEGVPAVTDAIVPLAGDPDPDVRANVVGFGTEFAHNWPDEALGVAGLEATLRQLAADEALDPAVRRGARDAADYCKSLARDPDVVPPGGAAVDPTSLVDVDGPGETVDLTVAEVADDGGETAARGVVGGVDVVVTTPPVGLEPGDTVSVAVEEATDGATVRARPVDASSV